METIAERPLERQEILKPLFEKNQPLRVRYAAGELIAQIGSYVAGLHLILSGAVHDALPASPWSARNTALLGPGDLVGIECLERPSDGMARTMCRAIAPTRLLFIERQAVARAMETDAQFRDCLTRYLAHRCFTARRNALWSQAPHDVRLAHVLRQLGSLCGEPTADGRIRLPECITMRTLNEIAAMTGRQSRAARKKIGGMTEDETGIAFHAGTVEPVDASV